MSSHSIPRTLATALAVLAGVLVISVLSPAGRAMAVAGGGSTPFAVTPVAAADGSSRSYFDLQAAPGATLHDQVVVSNGGKETETLKISAARGTTAPNTGSAFAGAFTACSGTACWLSGLPDELSLAPGESRMIPFSVHVPAGTTAKQYLAGITVRPAADPAPVTVGGGNGSKAQAVIINQISVGVAITVGSHLKPGLAIESVAGGVTGRTSLLQITVHNPGQTFVHGTGKAVCAAPGGDLTFPVGVNTVLPGDSGTVQVTATGLPAGSTECTVAIDYGDGAGTAQWKGTVSVPKPDVVQRVQVAPGVYAALPDNHLPTWAIGLMIAGGVAILALIVVLVVILARRRRARAQAQEATQKEEQPV